MLDDLSIQQQQQTTTTNQGTFFFLNDLFLYLAIDTVFYPSGIFKMAWKFHQNFMFKDGVLT